MKKKYYLPDNFATVFLCTFLLVLGLLPLYVTAQVIIAIFKNIGQSSVEDTMIRVVIGIISILPIILLGYKISQYMCYTIVLDKDKIYISDDTNPNKKKIQYYTFVDYISIQNIDIVWSNKKSNGEKSGIHSITGGGANIPYLLIETKNDEKKLFMIMFTSKKTVAKLILELKCRMESKGNKIQTIDIDSIIKKIK